jgi:hypothetical protein
MADTMHALAKAGELWGDSAPKAYAAALEKGTPFLLCTHPVSMQRADLGKIKLGDYVVGDKTDGVRQFLLIATHENQKYVCVIDRNCTVTMLPSVRVSNMELYKGTLIDGEFIASSATLVALDIVAFNGLQAWRAPHGKRMGALHSILPAILTDGWRIVPKAWYPLSAVASIPGAEGLIFVPVQEGMKPGKCDSLFKWKAVHTVDFLVKADGLYVSDRGQPLCVSHMFSLAFAAHASDSVVECTLHPMPQHPWLLHVVKVRQDKSTPNDIKTLHATMRNVLEAVHRPELNACLAK